MKPFRIEKVSSEVRSIVSDAISNRLQDPRIAPMTSVTRVEVSRDLESAKIYVSVLGNRSDEIKTIQALQNAAGYIQRLLAKSLPIRQCPRLVFHGDDSLKKGDEVLKMIDESIRELQADEAGKLQHGPDGSQPSGGSLE